MYKIPGYEEPLLRAVVTEQMVEGFGRQFGFHMDGTLSLKSVRWFMDDSPFLSRWVDAMPMVGDGMLILWKGANMGAAFVKRKLDTMFRMLRDRKREYVFDEFGELLLYEMILAAGREQAWRTTPEPQRSRVRAFFAEEAQRRFAPSPDGGLTIEMSEYAERYTERFTDFRQMGAHDSYDAKTILYSGEFTAFYDHGYDALCKVFADRAAGPSGLTRAEVICDVNGFRRSNRIGSIRER